MSRPSDSDTSIMSITNLVQTLRRRRRELGLSQSELAGLAGISLEGLSKIERGDAEPKIVTVMKLVKLLGGNIRLNWRRE